MNDDKDLFFNKAQIEKIMKKYPTPFHLYDEKGIRENAKRLYAAFAWTPGFKNYFAVKGLPEPLHTRDAEGRGMRCRLQLAS